ncbi:hypothetical protein ONO86_01189 [Micromonospora noduli]|nr:hypothetical protein ONO86_01189 [Micromonospora noduli]
MVAGTGCGGKHLAARGHEVDVRAGLRERRPPAVRPDRAHAEHPVVAGGERSGVPAAVQVAGGGHQHHVPVDRVPHGRTDLRVVRVQHHGQVHHVGVMVDGPPDGPGELVGADRTPRLPPLHHLLLTHPHRQDPGTRCQAAEGDVAAGCRDDDARHTGAVPGAVPTTVPAGVEQVGAGQHPPSQLRVHPVHPGVDHRDGHPGAGGQRREPRGVVPLLWPGRGRDRPDGGECCRAGRCRPEPGGGGDGRKGRYGQQAGGQTCEDRACDRSGHRHPPYRVGSGTGCYPLLHALADRRQPAIVILVPPCRLYAIPVACSRKGRWP